MSKLVRQLSVDTAYLLIGFPIAVVAYTVVLTLFSTGTGMVVTLVGFPILVTPLADVAGTRDRRAPAGCVHRRRADAAVAHRRGLRAAVEARALVPGSPARSPGGSWSPTARWRST